MLEIIKSKFLENVHPMDYVAGFVWFIAWILNTLKGLHFDLDKLWTFYGTFRLYILADKAVDSKYNSPPGQLPGKKE